MSMFSNLTDKLESAFRTLRGHGKITEINIAETMREVRRALLDADVNYKVAKSFCDTVKEKALGQDILINVEPGKLMVKICYDELIALMGGTKADINFASTPPTVILMSGLQGSGKTTFSGKLANFLKTKRSKKPLLVACDVYRPAAIDQLKTLGQQINIEVYAEENLKDAVGIAQRGVEYGKSKGFDTIIIDTAGRLAVDEEMMNEIAAIKNAVQPNEILFVVDAMTGQDAVNTAQAFNQVLDFHGVVLTKLDGDTRGGAALSIKAVVNKPIKYIGIGEKMDAIDEFYPDRMASRILGMGDIVKFVEKVQEQYDEKEAKRLQQKLRKNEFNFEDFMSQLQQIKKMGSIKDLIGMLPGINRALKDVEIDENAFKHIEAIINSMTIKERRNPEIINGSRRRRIAQGSGTSVQQVNQLMKQFDEMRKMMKTMMKLNSAGRSIKGLPFGKK